MPWVINMDSLMFFRTPPCDGDMLGYIIQNGGEARGRTMVGYVWCDDFPQFISSCTIYPLVIKASYIGIHGPLIDALC